MYGFYYGIMLYDHNMTITVGLLLQPRSSNLKISGKAALVIPKAPLHVANTGPTWLNGCNGDALWTSSTPGACLFSPDMPKDSRLLARETPTCSRNCEGNQGGTHTSQKKEVC